jgi:hypothetical protein
MNGLVTICHDARKGSHIGSHWPNHTAPLLYSTIVSVVLRSLLFKCSGLRDLELLGVWSLDFEAFMPHLVRRNSSSQARVVYKFMGSFWRTS